MKRIRRPNNRTNHALLIIILLLPGILFASVNAQFTYFNPASGSYSPGKQVTSSCKIKNTGTERHTFWIGYSVQDRMGKWYDVPSTAVTLSAGQESSTIKKTWQIPLVPITGHYNVRMSIWDTRPEQGDVTEANRLANKDAYKAFSVSSGAEIREASPDMARIRLLPIKLVVSSIMDSYGSSMYNYYDPFLWEYNVGAQKDIPYNENANKITLTLSSIKGSYRDRTHLYLLIEDLNVDRVEMRTGFGYTKRLSKKVISAPGRDASFMYEAFDCGNVNWSQGVTFSIYLSGQQSGDFYMTLIAQDPSAVYRFIEGAGEFVYGPIISMVKLLGYSDTYATSFAMYKCSFGSSVGDVSRMRTAYTIRDLILKPLLSAIQGAGRY